MTSTPPGWYDDGRGAKRWWDGAQWTEHTAVPDAAAPAATALETVAPEAGVPQAGAPQAWAPEAGVPEPAGLEALPPELSNDPAVPLPPYAGGPGYPGISAGAPPSGVFVAATESKKSRAWIIWLVAGIVLLGIVIAAAVLIPIFFLNLATSGTQADGPDQQLAVDAVVLYDEAWREVDCDKFFEATTDNFRGALSLTDCASFEQSAQDFGETVSNYTVTVLAIEQDGSTVSIDTSETYDSSIDENGDPADPPIPFEDLYTYEVIPAGAGWAIDDAS